MMFTNDYRVIAGVTPRNDARACSSQAGAVAPLRGRRELNSDGTLPGRTDGGQRDDHDNGDDTDLAMSRCRALRRTLLMGPAAGHDDSKRLTDRPKRGDGMLNRLDHDCWRVVGVGVVEMSKATQGDPDCEGCRRYAVPVQVSLD